MAGTGRQIVCRAMLVAVLTTVALGVAAGPASAKMIIFRGSQSIYDQYYNTLYAFDDTLHTRAAVLQVTFTSTGLTYRFHNTAETLDATSGGCNQIDTHTVDCGTQTSFPVDIGVELYDGKDSATFSVPSNARVIANGGSGDDYMIGGAGGDYLEGGTGDDTIDGAGGNDQIFGNDGADKLYGAAGDDLIDGGGGKDFLYGYTGKDRLTGSDGADTLEGDSGADTLHGSDGNDTLNGNSGNDKLYGDGGDDYASGGGGDDKVHGGDGNDALHGSSGKDTLYGEGGDDRLSSKDGHVESDFCGSGSDKVHADNNDALSSCETTF